MDGAKMEESYGVTKTGIGIGVVGRNFLDWIAGRRMFNQDTIP